MGLSSGPSSATVHRDTTVEARWLVLRVLGVACSALLFEQALPFAPVRRLIGAAFLTALAYASLIRRLCSGASREGAPCGSVPVRDRA